MYLSSCSVVHKGLPLIFFSLVRARLHCSVKGLVGTVVIKSSSFLFFFNHHNSFQPYRAGTVVHVMIKYPFNMTNLHVGSTVPYITILLCRFQRMVIKARYFRCN